MGLRDRYGILATAFDSRFISNRFKLERNIRLGCGAVPHQGGLNLSAILFIEHNRLFMPFQLRVHRHYDHFSRFISYDEILCVVTLTTTASVKSSIWQYISVY